MKAIPERTMSVLGHYHILGEKTATRRDSITARTRHSSFVLIVRHVLKVDDSRRKDF
jgi:hypothetical protein